MVSSVWPQERPYITVILAMTADGKISDRAQTPARFGSVDDRAHLEAQIAQADMILLGANTLRAYETSLTVRDPLLLQARRQRGQPAQPIHLICSRSGNLQPTWRFFAQPFPRWLLTTPHGQRTAQNCAFERVLAVNPLPNGRLPWSQVWPKLNRAGMRRLAVLGGGELVASLSAIAAIDEIWLTVCPVWLGGRTAPTPYDGQGTLLPQAQQLELLSYRVMHQEVLLHYRVCPADLSAVRLPTGAPPNPPLEQ